ncbi:sensor histidine kinase [Plantactinospora endophytica]|uniref:histidine kinase n=1 Tax=Plantactinospora endophytica TaxID=673535 RepID=A0ABQ4E499_9ACTN|nr:HAMP domain-containing sensor histidine kinase [Plantactinospora endophytica]GIG89527.1 sensor protein CutS [Plantactinospora endophytica]
MRRLSPARLTIRGRLTLVYGGLFLLAGLLLLGVTYALMSQRLPQNSTFTVSRSGPVPDGPSTAPPAVDGATGAALGGEAGLPSPTEVEQVTRAAALARQDALEALLTQGGIALVVVGVAATAFGWLIAGRLLQPLHRVTETARRIAGAPDADRGLHERIALTGPPDEIRELADTFDLMLARLDQAFDSQRRFIGNASHELRTPLTLNRTLLEVMVDPGSASPELRQLGSTLLAVNARHERLIDGLLLLARSEGEVAERSYVDLADVVEHVVGQLPPGPVGVRAEPAEAATTGSSVLLERLVQNLVENGVRHNVAEHGWVRVSSGSGPAGTVRVRVENSGPVVPRYEIPSLFEPFRRLGGDRLATNPAGAGLGLSIVRAVARAHGGTVAAEPRDGGGLVVTVTLPAAR